MGYLHKLLAALQCAIPKFRVTDCRGRRLTDRGITKPGERFSKSSAVLYFCLTRLCVCGCVNSSFSFFLSCFCCWRYARVLRSKQWCTARRRRATFRATTLCFFFFLLSFLGHCVLQVETSICKKGSRSGVLGVYDGRAFPIKERERRKKDRNKENRSRKSFRRLGRGFFVPVLSSERCPGCG